MALTEITNPRLTFATTPIYASDAASTTQLLYKFNEDNTTFTNYYTLRVVIPELNNFTLFYPLLDPSGDIEFDLGDAIAQAMAGNSVVYHVVATPVRDGVDETPVVSIDILAVKSNIQILTTNRSNLYDYIGKDVTAPSPGKFMTWFETPKIWNGWKTSNHIINQDITGTINVYTEDLDINKVPLATDNTADIWAAAMTVESYPIPYPLTANSYYVNFQYQKTDFTPLSVLQTYQAMPECREPVMLQWLNELGGTDYWLFSMEQSITNIAEEGLRYETPITTDLSTVTGNKFRFSDKDTQFMTLRAEQLTQNEIQALHYLKKSTEVKVALDKDLGTFVDVVVSASFSDDFTTGKTNYTFSVTIEFPNNFDFFKAKAY